MKNLISTIILILAYASTASAQCDTGSEPECMCSTADVLCSLNDLDGFSFRMGALNHPADAPNPLCPGSGSSIPQNPNWFAFTSFCTDISIEVFVDNCDNTGFSGAQIAVYSDCNFTPVDCDVSTGDCTWPSSRTINLTNLILGNTYYFLVDGCGGDVCDISVDVLGSCGANEIDNFTFGIDGPEAICALGTYDYIFERPNGTDRLFYTINGGTPTESFGNPVSIDFPSFGTYTICIDVDNEPCVPITDNPPEYCTTIEVVDVTAEFDMSPISGCPGSTMSTVSVSPAFFNPVLEYQFVVVDQDGFVAEVILDDQGVINLTECGVYDVHLITSFGEADNLIYDPGDFFLYLGCLSGCCHMTTQVLRIEDFNPPTFLGAPVDVTLDCSADLETLIIGPDAFDDCGVAQDTFTRRIVSQSCDSSVYVYYWSAIDFCDNEARDSSRVVLSHIPTVQWEEEPIDSLLSCITLLPDPYYINYDIQSASSCGSDSVLAEVEFLAPNQVEFRWAVADSCITDTLRQLWTVADSVSLRFTEDVVSLCGIGRVSISDILDTYLENPDTIPYTLTTMPLATAGDSIDISVGAQIRIEASGSVSCPLIDSIFIEEVLPAMVDRTVTQAQCGGEVSVLNINSVVPVGSIVTDATGTQIESADTLDPGTYTYFTLTPAGCIDSFSIDIGTPQVVALQLESFDCTYLDNEPDSVIVRGSIEDLFANVTTLTMMLNGANVPVSGSNTFTYTVAYADPLLLDIEILTDQNCLLDLDFTIPEVCASCEYTWSLPDTISRACAPLEACVTPTFSEVPEAVIWTYNNNLASPMEELCADQEGWYVMEVRFDSICTFVDSVYLDTELGVESITYTGDTLLNCLTSSISIDYTATLDPSAALVEVRYQGTPFTGGSIMDPGSYELILIHEASGCRLDSATIDIAIDTMPPDFNLIVSPDSTVDCITQFVSLVLDYPDTTMRTEWLVNGELLSDIDSIQLDSSAFVQVTLTNVNNGCTANAAVSITDLVNFPVINEFPASELTCTVDTIKLDASSSVASPASLYEWYDDSGTLLVSDAEVLSVSSPGIYRLRIIDPETGCDEEKEVEVTQNLDEPIVRLATDLIDLSCDTPSTSVDLIDLEPNVSLNWIAGGMVLSMGNDFVVSNAGTYTMLAVNLDNGCTYQDSFRVTTAGIETIDLLVDPAVCIGEEGMVTLTAIVGGQPGFDINLDNENLQLNEEALVDPGTYALSIVDAAGCVFDTMVMINTLSELNLATTFDTIIYSEVNQVIMSLPSDVDLGNVELTWSANAPLSCFDCPRPQLEQTYTGDVEAAITDTYGCMRTANFYLLFQSDAFTFPNIFSPRSTVGNDRFSLKAADGSAIVTKMLIYDRWGSLMYKEEGLSINDPAHGWDGRFDGTSVSPGVYIYFAEIQVNGEVVQVTGDVTIVD